MSRKYKLHQHWKKVATLHEDQFTFLITSCSILCRRRNVAEKSRGENKNTHFIFNNYFKKSYCLRDNVEKYQRARKAADDN
jgi:hypothetical protein